MKIVFATGNPHKLKEIKEIAGDTDIEFVLPAEGFNPVENGDTFEENSLIKAKEAARVSKMISLADDTGLCVESLGGAPGIHSARYADTGQARIDKLLKELEPYENRNAEFVCAMTLVDENGNLLHSATGICKGKIAKNNQVTADSVMTLYLLLKKKIKQWPNCLISKRTKSPTAAEL